MSLLTTHRERSGSALPARVSAARREPARRWSIWLMILLVAAWPCRAEERVLDPGSDADFLQHLATFVEWPPAAFGSPDAPFVIGVLGDETACRALGERLAGGFVGLRGIVVQPVGDHAGAASCHLLFVIGVEASRLHKVWRGIGGRPVLTVGKGTAFVQAGGMVGVERRGTDKVLYLNTRPLRDAGLTASSKLLEIAQVMDVAVGTP